MIISILLPIKTSKTFFYTTAVDLKAGTIVIVPFRKKELFGLVMGAHNDAEVLPSQTFHIKSIVRNTNFIFKDSFLKFLQAFSSYNMIPLGSVFKMTINSSLKTLLQQSAKKIESAPSSALHNEKTQQPDILLSATQERTLHQLEDAFKTKHTALLQGITGSGKTIIYLKYIEKILDSNHGQALILLPEITLSTQIAEKFQSLLPHKNIIQWNSSLPLKSKKAAYASIIKGEEGIIIGARSALLLPFCNLKIIIVDEEHDNSFKQEDNPIYNARDMSILRSKIENVPVILSSATPSIETLYNCQIGKYAKISIDKRFGASIIPTITVIDMLQTKLPKDHFISAQLQEALKQTLSENKQSLLFLNRKGYAPITLCRKCGTKITCKNCSTTLVYYKTRPSLNCHYCGYQTSISSTCSNCHSTDMISYGAGVEKIAEEVTKLLPNAKITIATSDIMSDHVKINNLLEQILKKEIDIIIGTQMLAKGLNFPLLKLVGVIEADCHYISGDIRAHERMFQLLQQVAGRAGRAADQGEVLLQSYTPKHPILQKIITADVEGFFNEEIQDRKLSASPPFMRVVTINLSCLNETKLMDYAHQLHTNAPHIEGITIFGPASPPIDTLKKNHRLRFIIKALKTINIQEIIYIWLSSIKTPASIKVKIDVDPYNFI